MPQPGDGNLWPNTDDDTPRGGGSSSSAQVNEGDTKGLPARGQQEKPASAGWFDPPAADEPGDKSHPKPSQQRTQPVSWPVTEVERRAKASSGASDGESTVFVKPVEIKPPPSNATRAATAFATPRKPDKSGLNGAPEGKSTRSSGPGKDRGWFDSPSEDRMEEPAASTQEPKKTPPHEPENLSPREEPASEDEVPAEPTAEESEAEETRPDTDDEPAAETPSAVEAEPDEEAGPAETEPPAEAPPAADVESEAADASSVVEDPSAATDAQPDEEAETEEAQPADVRPATESATVSLPTPTEAEEDSEDAPADEGENPQATAELPKPDNSTAWPTESAETEQPESGPDEPARAEDDSPATDTGDDRLAWPSAEPPAAEQRENKAESAPPRPESQPTAKAAEGWPRSDESGAGSGDAAATTVFRPVEPVRPERKEPARPPAREADAATSVFRPVEPPRGERPDATTNLFRPPDQRPRPPRNPGVDSPTVNYLRPVQPPRQEDPPSFVRPRQPAPNEGATVNLARPAERSGDWLPPEPPRAAPQRVGPEPEEPKTKQKSRKKPLLVAAIAIVAVIGVAAGVVFGVPGLAQKLGLAGEDLPEIAAPPGPISYTPGLHGPTGDAPKPTRQGVEQALAGPISNPALGTVTGIVIDPATGELLYERDAGQAITPASTGKLLTAAAALLSLDHTQQLVTKVVAGDQPGEVIIVGGGDPTISSLEPGNDDSVFKGAAHLSELVDQVKASGVPVQTVYIDQSRYAAPHMAPSWLPADVGAGYIAPIVPAMLDGDRRDATKNYSPRTNDPGRTLVDEFARRVGASPAGSIEKKAPPNAKVLGEIRSAPVSQLVDNMLDHSENTLGDILAHEVAIKAGEQPNFEGAAKAMLDVLRQNKFDVEGVVLKDGSGMSTENKVSAKLLAQVLAVAAGPDGKDERTAKLRPLLGGLPVAGGSGTLEDRYNQGAATEGRGWVRAKTGTLTGVNSLAGIVMDKDNRPLVFAFLTSGTEGSTARPALDTAAAALRGCGCQ